MKLNNKGFAISTVLYSLLMMATLILFLLIGTLSFERRTTTDFSNNIKDELNTFISDEDNLNGAISSNIRLQYQVYISYAGWEDYRTDDEIAGTTGQTRQLQAFRILVENQNSITGNIEYRAHIQDIGWQDYAKNGEVSGSGNQTYRLEAIQIRLTGELANHFDIEYRVHVQNIGWQNYVKNDQVAGTTGQSLAIEAMQIRLVPKSEDGNIKISSTDYLKYIDGSNVKFGDTFKLVSLLDNNYAISVRSNNISPNSFITILPFQNNTGQKFKIQTGNGDTDYAISVSSSTNNLVIGSQNNSSSVNSYATLSTLNYLNGQLWTFNTTNNANYYIIRSKYNACLSIEGETIRGNANILAGYCNNRSNAQRWGLVKV